MTRIEGYQDDNAMLALPIKRGDTVIIKKGTIIYVVGQEPKPAGRTYQVKVHSLSPGQNRPVGHPQHDPSYGVQNPRIVWPGSGGYWTECDVNDVVKAPAK